ncbi:MAG: NDP-sugar synthase, partial [Chloroflexota bacterium]|nr:NDP-sugar synthase [Chloroflexota bacterium]
MKAVILVGGEGSRLRPLTTNTPKPLLPLVNRPFLDHVLYGLSTHGIHDVVLAMSYLSESFEDLYGDGSHLGMRLRYVKEEEPLGTGGAIKNVQSYLDDETFFVFNGDILTDLDLTDVLRFHRDNGSHCTISLTSVEDPSAYGVVDLDDKGRIEKFTEKPKREATTSNWINAGTYVMEPQILDYIPEGAHHMVERGLFPTLLKDGKPLYGYRAGAYWMDIGTPAKYLEAHSDILSGRLKRSIEPQGELLWEGVWVGEGVSVDSGARIVGPVVLGREVVVGPGASIVGPSALGEGCHVGEEAQLERVVAWDGALFEAKSRASNSVVGKDATVGQDSRVEERALIG